MTNKNNNKNDDDNQTSKFSLEQRIESTKSALVGLLSGGIAVAPFAAIRDIVFMGGGHSHVLNGIAQWEFDTDMGSLMAALFAIVYRYCIREGDDNPQLNQGVLGAFVLTRTLSQIQVPTYCSAIPLDCGSPLGYFDWDMISQGILTGSESLALFGSVVASMEYCFQRGLISRFR